MRRLIPVLPWLLCSALALFLAPAAHAADETAGGATLCQQAIAMAERGAGVPDQLLDAISRVESGRYDPGQGMIRAWPWTINAEGQGHFYASKQEAVAAAQAFRSRGVTSIDVGCTQINLMFHPDAFASLDDAFDPVRNAVFAAHFLTDLFHQQGSWPHAAAAYHSQTPELGTDYQRRVLEAWAQPIDAPAPRRHEAYGGALGGGDFHSQVATLASAASAIPTHPFGGASGLPPGVTGRIIHQTGVSQSGVGRMSGVTGRTLAAYRAMPVLGVHPPALATQFRGVAASVQVPAPAFARGFVRPMGPGGSLFTSPRTPYAMLASPSVHE